MRTLTYSDRSECTGDRYYDDREYLGEPCGSCREYNCPGANGGSECPESPHYPDNSPDWCNCAAPTRECPWNAAILADEAPPSGEVVRTFHFQLRRQDARDYLRSKLAELRQYPMRGYTWRYAFRAAAELIGEYRDTRIDGRQSR